MRSDQGMQLPHREAVDRSISGFPEVMEPCSATYQIRGRQARSAAGNNDGAGAGGVGARPVVSALAVPDDPLDGVMQCLGVGSGFAAGADDCWATGSWFDDFRGGSMDMSTHAGVDYFLEMPLELPDTTSVLAAKGATETATTRAGAAVEGDMEVATSRAEAVPLPDRPAVMMNLSPSFSSSDEDDAPWMSSSDSPSEDDDADDHWLPCESKKSGGTKRRLQQQQHQQHGVAGGHRKHQLETVVPPAPGSVVVAVEGGDGADNGYRCYICDTSTTPLWRSGPDGPKTLCNRCGLQYSKLRAPTTRKRLPAAKPGIGSAKSANYPVMPLAEGATVVRKKRSVALRIG